MLVIVVFILQSIGGILAFTYREDVSSADEHARELSVAHARAPASVRTWCLRDTSSPSSLARCCSQETVVRCLLSLFSAPPHAHARDTVVYPLTNYPGLHRGFSLFDTPSWKSSRARRPPRTFRWEVARGWRVRLQACEEATSRLADRLPHLPVHPEGAVPHKLSLWTEDLSRVRRANQEGWRAVSAV